MSLLLYVDLVDGRRIPICRLPPTEEPVDVECSQLVAQRWSTRANEPESIHDGDTYHSSDSDERFLRAQYEEVGDSD